MPLQHLSDLPNDERRQVLAKLHDVPRIAEHEGYEPWEYREQVSAEGRDLGLALTHDEVSTILSLARTA